MDFLCSYNRINEFNCFFDLVNDNCDTIELCFDLTGLSVNVLNKGNVCFYKLMVYQNFFLEYNVSDPVSLTLDCNEFYSVLKQLKGYECIVLDTEENILEVIGMKHGGNKVRFTLSLIEDSYSSPTPPQIEYDNYFTVELTDLKAAAETLGKVCKTDRFKVLFDDSSRVKIVSPGTVITGYDQTLIVDGEGNGEVVVNTKYISDLGKLGKINKLVMLELGNSIPLSWCIDGESKDIRVSGLIAPILEEE